ncbi:MAG: type II toxin-antitoxin system PemK/MazF family toxin [Thermodesulfobacteriota bacterium]|nr:type II toxin-antitoxin system PemK/MazF family toxin [Thermodesulfobacteriota bacterium]
MRIRRSGVYVATLDPVVGREISKTRPVLVISNDKNNEFGGTVTVLPLTSKHVDKIYPFEAALPKGAANLPKHSKVKADQIRTLDRKRLVKFIGVVEEKTMRAVERAVLIHLGLGV